MSKMFSFVVLITLTIITIRCNELLDLNLDQQYHNLSTEGNLVANLYRVVLDKSNPPPAIRVSVSSEKSSLKNPLTVNVIHSKTIHNIAIPRIQSQQEQRFEYWVASDTLCDYDGTLEELGQPVQLSISSSLPSLFGLRIESVDDFHIGTNSVKARASPSEPRFYMYTFPENVDKVDVRIISNTEICARLMTRHADCPLFDASGLTELSDVYFYQSFTKFAGFSLRKSDIGPNFHLAFTVNPDDSVCGTKSDSINSIGRMKDAIITVTPVSEKSILSLLPLFVYVISIIIVLILTYWKYKWLDRFENNEPTIFEGNNSEGNVIVDKIWLFDHPTNIVSHKEYEKQRLVKDSKYFNFLFFQIFGSVLPALTTLFENRQMSSNKMDLDRCYLNYLCSSDFFDFNSVNAMLSASSLAIIAILNLIVVFRKRIFDYQIPRFPSTHGIEGREAPKVVCLLGLVAMGLLWTINSNCPHKTTLHLYTYTSLWVCYSTCMWIYSKRHGVRKWQQFYIIAVSSVFGFITLVENMFAMDREAEILIKFLFFVAAVSSTGYLCFNYYYERPSGLQDYQWIKNPLEKSQDLVLADTNCVYQPLNSKILYIVLSMLYSIASSFTMITFPNQPVYTTCQILGKGQVAIYLIYYIVQKIRFERSSFSLSYILKLSSLTVACFFLEGVSRVLANVFMTFQFLTTPAKSRELNAECILPGIDLNDIRHYNCAFDRFLFIILIDFIDSNIKGVPKKNIFVF